MSTEDDLTDEQFEDKYKRERREEMELAVRLNLEANTKAREEGLAAEQAVYEVRIAGEHAERRAQLEIIDANERKRDAEARADADVREKRAVMRSEQAEERYDAKTAERDRRVTWWCAVEGASANPNCPDAASAAEYADDILAEYDKRWPEGGV